MKPKATPSARQQLYRKRAKLKRWQKEIADYEVERDDKVKAGPMGYSGWTPDVLQCEINIRQAKIEALQKEDLRTAEEKRGYNRKTYVRTKTIELRGIPDELVATIERRHRRLAREHARQEIENNKPGSAYRQFWYEMHRDSLIAQFRYYDSKSSTKRTEILAALAELDEKYSDCDTAPELLSPQLKAHRWALEVIDAENEQKEMKARTRR